ncbi:MAG: SIS domain-containing protein [Rhodospirillales bacterium]|nr:SIS domain-containing protein [Rhodospirillales bacterium]
MKISDYLKESAENMAKAAEHGLDAAMEQSIKVISDALKSNKSFLVCGNGGSASDAMHIAGELVARFLKERNGYKCIALGANTAQLTAWSNDYDYESAFAREVEAYGENGGVILGISTSGNSANVIKAFEKAKEKGMTVIAMTGLGGGKMAVLSDILLDAPLSTTARIQEVHINLYHYLCERIEDEVS